MVRYNRYTDDREAMARELQSKSPGMAIVPSSGHPNIVAGQGTIGYELFEEVGELDHLLAPIGGGGNVSGNSIAAKHLSPNCQVYGVEPQNCGDAKISVDTGVIKKITPGFSICDGAQNAHIDPLTMATMRQNVGAKNILEV